MVDWRIKDYKTLCLNLQNKLTPYKASENDLFRKMRVIQKSKKCDELTAWKTLKCQLQSKLIKKRTDNAPLCKNSRQTT